MTQIFGTDPSLTIPYKKISCRAQKSIQKALKSSEKVLKRFKYKIPSVILMVSIYCIRIEKYEEIKCTCLKIMMSGFCSTKFAYGNFSSF